MASWLAELRPAGVAPETPVFATATGAPLNYGNVYNRVLRPALVKAGIAVKVGEVMVRRRGGREEARPVWDYQRVGFHAFRHACGSILHEKGMTLAQAQGWLRHGQLTTTMGYTHTGQKGIGNADAFDEILDIAGLRETPTSGPPSGTPGTPRVPQTPGTSRKAATEDSASESQISDQPQTAGKG